MCVCVCVCGWCGDVGVLGVQCVGVGVGVQMCGCWCAMCGVLVMACHAVIMPPEHTETF